VQRKKRDELVAFGSAVRQLRTRRKWSQEELAEFSDLHRTYLSGVERGERNPGLLNVHRIAKALQVRTSELLALAEGTRVRH
jgi:transcriptional regulator with XRE-family HTH domain